MKKSTIKPILLCLSLAVVLALCLICLTACENDDQDTAPEEPTTYTVTFKADGAVVSKETFTASDKTITEPNVPVKIGYHGIWEKYTLSSNNLTVNATYTPITYTATFVADGETITTNSFTIENMNMDFPAIPEKAGYVAQWETYSLSPCNLTINAIYTTIPYTITFMADNNIIDTKIYDIENMDVVTPAIPQKAGYTSAWENYLLTAGNLIVNAIYTPITYTATFIAEDKTVDTQTFTIENMNVEVPAIPIKEGYAAEWENYTLTTSNITINAIYTISPYIVTFVADGKAIASKGFDVENMTVKAPSVPEKTGYTGSWEPYTLTTGNITVNAIYTPVTYTATFVADGKTVTTKTFTVENMNIEAPEVPEKEHYSGVWDTYTLTTNNITVNAIYTPVTYTATFVADGEIIATRTFTVENMNVEPPSIPVKNGYAAEWEEYVLSAKDSVIQAIYSPFPYSVTFIANGITIAVKGFNVENMNVSAPKIPNKPGYIGAWENYTLTTNNIFVNAIYTPITYTATFIADGETIATRTFTVENLTLDAPMIPNKTGYTASWEKYVLTANNKTIHAIYTPITYSLTIIGNGGISTTVAMAFNEEIIASKMCVREGYDIEGLYTDIVLSNRLITMPAEDTTVYARWYGESLPSEFSYFFSSNRVTINGYQGSENAVIIPAYIGGYPVTDIESSTSIIIPASVTSIGYGAFQDCTKLISISLPFVGESKEGSENIHFGYIFGATFAGENNDFVPSTLKTVKITGGTNIGYSAFYGCSNLSSVAIPNSVTCIDAEAFLGCTSLIRTTSDGVQYVDKWVVGCDTSVTSISLLSDTVGCVADVFLGCRDLRVVYFSDLTAWCNIKFSNGSANPLYHATLLYINGKETKGSIIIADGVTKIDNSAFAGLTGLTSITLPSSVTSIGDAAFANCTGLKSINIPYGVTSIGNSAFSGCAGLISITIPDSVTSIGNSAFKDCANLISITIGNSVKSIGYEAFLGCTNIIQTEDNVHYVDKWVVGYENSPATVSLRKDTQGIASMAFSHLDNLTTVIIPNSVTSIGDYTFYNCAKLKSITIPDNVIYIGQAAFYGCVEITSVNIPQNVTHIGWAAFHGCSGLTSIIIPDNISEISAEMFSGCSRLTCITIPDGIVSIGDNAFQGCTNLTSITIPDSVICIGNYAFSGCSKLTSIIIGNSVTRIGNRAFAYCTELVSIIIPRSVTIIGNYVFSGCTGLITSIIFEDDSTWYHAADYYLNGTKTDVTNANTNATYFSSYADHYWYKL